MMRLALGTVQFGLPYGVANQSGQVSREQSQAMLDLAIASKIDTLDTAIAYGESEVRLGALGINDFKAITKLPALPEGLPDVASWVQSQVEASMSRLGVSVLYGLLLHRSEQLLGPDGLALYKALYELKDSGLVQKIGISVYSPRELDAICPLFSLDLVQAPFNLVDRRLQSSGWLRRLKAEGVEVHTRSTFLQGLLLMGQDERPSKFMAWSDLWATWDKWLVERNVAPVHACLGFVLEHPEIERVVVGADSSMQLTQLIDAACAPKLSEFPNLDCIDELLINPARWPLL
jgi:aryl-alcohol dehydrogenase-like predicted oxidoreductase